MDKWNAQQWHTQTQAEAYASTEDVTQPPAIALLKQAGLLPPRCDEIVILDNGAGMGQMTEMYLANNGQARVICGDVEPSLLEAVRGKKAADGEQWGKVEVQKLDAMVRLLFPCLYPVQTQGWLNRLLTFPMAA
jgi:2-polyprenyl-3-methyl-5-hydroxy-6-metoxy-1,4-benzoquinol methylase